MSDVDDIEILLAKAKKHTARIMWAKVAIVSLATFGGSAFGAGMTVAKYAANIMTRDDAAKLFEGRQAEIRAIQTAAERLTDRVTAAEGVNGFQDQRLTEQRADIKDLASRSGVLVRGRP